MQLFNFILYFYNLYTIKFYYKGEVIKIQNMSDNFKQFPFLW